MFNDLLFEIGTEELPSGAVNPLGVALAANITQGLTKANLAFGQVLHFATPRRIAVLIKQVQLEQASYIISRRGPALSAALDEKGEPTPALLGFAKSCGVGVEHLTTIETDKGAWWMYESTQPGMNTKDLLPEILSDAVAHLPIPKPMRWGAGTAEFARPVHWALLLLGQEVICTNILGVTTGQISYGHRYHHPESLTILSPEHYESQLQDAFVIASFSKRRAMIVEQVTALTQKDNKIAIMPEDLLDEVTSIVEWPQALLVNFEEDFLNVPAEALIAAMQSHQKCFALRDQNNQLLPQFVTIANIMSRNPQQVITGNESVMRARLSDAAFFFHQDKKQPLIHHQASTERVLFQKQLGSLADKARRVQDAMRHYAEILHLNLNEANRAAELSKCDLMTGMVGEFPELQGLMGYYYALADGETPAVAHALNEQYMPRFAADELPASTLGLALSLADRLDTLVGTFSIGQKPSGTKDPFKLRRHALAVVRILIAIPTPLNLSHLIEKAFLAYGQNIAKNESALIELHSFILDRMQSYYQTQGIAPSLFYAARARENEWLYDIDKRVKALNDFMELPDAQALAAACKRVNNILHNASLQFDHQMVDVARFIEPAEKNLFERILLVEESIAPFYQAKDYGSVLSQLASLRESLDAFFEHVMVMVDDVDLRTNRLHVLLKLQHVLQGVADISLLQISA